MAESTPSFSTHTHTAQHLPSTSGLLNTFHAPTQPPDSGAESAEPPKPYPQTPTEASVQQWSALYSLATHTRQRFDTSKLLNLPTDILCLQEAVPDENIDTSFFSPSSAPTAVDAILYENNSAIFIYLCGL